MTTGNQHLEELLGATTVEELQSKTNAATLEQGESLLQNLDVTKNTILHLDDSDNERELYTYVAAFAAKKFVAEGKKIALVVPTNSIGTDVETALKTFEVESERNSVGSDGKLECGAPVLILDVNTLRANKTLVDGFAFDAIVFCGLDGRSAELDSSAPFERLITVRGEENTPTLAWMSPSIPLALRSLISSHFRTDSAAETNLANTDQPGEQKEKVELQHYYYEVSGDISAKPQALCDLIESHGRKKTIIFCNSPSDTDLVEVFLKRRGIDCRKLIGNVPPRKLQSVLKEVSAGEICALVVTDIAANNINIDEFEIAISHSCPTDPEIYLHRVGDTDSNSSLEKSISVVAPSDLTSFQYLRKIVQFEFEKGELPSQGEMMSAKIDALIEKANGAEVDEGYVETATEQLKQDGAAKLLAFLLKQYFEKPAQKERKSRRSRRDDDREDRYDDRDDDDYDDRRGGDRQSRDRDDSGRNRRSAVEMKTDVRFYIDSGIEEGFTEQTLNELLSNAGLETPLSPERMSIREHYSFVDFTEERAEEFAGLAEGLKLPDGEDLIAYRATTISSPKKVSTEDAEGEENGDGEANTAEAGDDSSSDEESASL